jgi:hypothetical protein
MNDNFVVPFFFTISLAIVVGIGRGSEGSPHCLVRQGQNGNAVDNFVF